MKGYYHQTFQDMLAVCWTAKWYFLFQLFLLYTVGCDKSSKNQQSICISRTACPHYLQKLILACVGKDSMSAIGKPQAPSVAFRQRFT